MTQQDWPFENDISEQLAALEGEDAAERLQPEFCESPAGPLARRTGQQHPAPPRPEALRICEPQASLCGGGRRGGAGDRSDQPARREGQPGLRPAHHDRMERGCRGAGDADFAGRELRAGHLRQHRHRRREQTVNTKRIKQYGDKDRAKQRCEAERYHLLKLTRLARGGTGLNSGPSPARSTRPRCSGRRAPRPRQHLGLDARHVLGQVHTEVVVAAELNAELVEVGIGALDRRRLHAVEEAHDDLGRGDRGLPKPACDELVRRHPPWCILFAISASVRL
jgi:hypothetical protein